MPDHSKSYSEDLRWVLVYMHHKRNLSINEIERLTGLKPHTIRRVLKLYEGTGKVMPPAAKSGRPRKFDESDIDVSDQICHCLFLGDILKECPFAVSQSLRSTFCRLLS